MPKVFIVIENKRTKIVGRIPDDLEISLPNLLGYKVKMRDRYGQLTHKLNTKYNRLKQSVPVGLTDRLLKIISDFGYETKILDKRELNLVDVEKVIENMKEFPYTLRPYQKQAFVVGIEEPLMTFSMATGCLSGDTMIRLNRNGKGYEISLEKLFKRFNQLDRKNYNYDGQTYVRSYNGFSIQLQPISGVVCSGTKKVYLLEIENGNKIEATDNHEFFTKTRGWSRLDQLEVDDEIMCDTLCPQKRNSGHKKRDVYVQNVKHLHSEKCKFNFHQGMPVFSRVISIKSIGKKMTYDIQCPVHHNFVANDIVAHNSGKTVVFGALALGMGLKTLMLINREDIMTQHYNTMKKIFPPGSVGIIQGKRMDFDAPICVGMVQTINARLKQKGERANNPKYHMTKYLESIEYVISDECHHSQSKTWKRVVRSCKNSRYHHGFSGSPWDRGSANLELECVCGAIKYKITASELINQGWLAKPHIFFHKYEGNDKHITGGNFQDMYTNTIVKNKKRNKAVVKVILDEYNNTDRKILVIVNRINHGHIISDMLREKGIDDRQLGYLHGSKGKIVREKGKAKFEEGKIRILIASNIFNEGIDIPSCDTLIKSDALGGGDNVFESEGIRSFIQQIGRVLRKPQKDDGGDKKTTDVDTRKEHVVYIHDFIDNQNKYVEYHTKNRIFTCRQEKAFQVRVEE